MLEIEGLEKTFSTGLFKRTQRKALAGVELQLQAGAAFGLIGLNGAGKTTLIKTILAVLHPSRGRVRVFGLPPQQVQVRKRVGYLPERLDFPKGMSPRSFLRSVARLKGLAKPQDQIERQLVRVGLRPHADGRVDRFSKGMRQRLGLAAAFLGDPEMLILDEPTDGLDPLGRVEIRRLLIEEQQRGVTIFLNSHLLAETEKICGRVGILHEGRLILEGPLERLARAEHLWRLTAQVSPEQSTALEALGLEPIQDEAAWRIRAEDVSGLNDTLDQVRALGVEVIELKRELRDLESILAEHVRGAK